jgi:hypothetical protein
MKIKPGDRCVIAFNTEKSRCQEQFLGRVIVVTHLAKALQWGFQWINVWEYEDQARCPNTGRPCPHMIVVPDADLIPLPPEHEVREHDAKNPVDTSLPIKPVNV